MKIVDPLPIGLIPLNITAEPGNFACQVEENPVNTVTCIEKKGDLEKNIRKRERDGDDHDRSLFVTLQKRHPSTTRRASTPRIRRIPTASSSKATKETTARPRPRTSSFAHRILRVNKSVDAGTAAPGQELTYTVSLTNNGTATALGPITLTDTLDTTKVDHITSNATNGFSCTFTSPDVECTNTGSLAPGESTTLDDHGEGEGRSDRLHRQHG